MFTSRLAFLRSEHSCYMDAVRQHTRSDIVAYFLTEAGRVRREIASLKASR